MDSEFMGPVNIGSDEMVSINQLAQMAIDLSGKKIKIKNLEGDDFKKVYGFDCPVGVRGRNSDNTLFESKLGWSVGKTLHSGMSKTYPWILSQFNSKK